jgi:hypothetical protein
MNGKKARFIRKVTADAAGRLGLPDKAYQTVKHRPKLYKTSELLPDGTNKMVSMVPETVGMTDCARKMYKKAKKVA